MLGMKPSGETNQTCIQHACEIFSVADYLAKVICDDLTRAYALRAVGFSVQIVFWFFF